MASRARARALAAGAGRVAFAGALASAVLGLAAPPAGAQDTEGSVTGSTVNVTLTSPQGAPVYVFALQFAPSAAGNVAGVTCGSGGTANPTGGPGGAPECLYSTPLTSTMLMVNGRAPWPSPLTLTPYYSYNNSNYVAGSPFTVATTPPPTSNSGSGAGSGATPPSSSSGTTPPTKAPSPHVPLVGASHDLLWLWLLLLGLGIVILGAGVWWIIRTKPEGGDVPFSYDDVGRVPLTYDDTGGAITPPPLPPVGSGPPEGGGPGRPPEPDSPDHRIPIGRLPTREAGRPQPVASVVVPAFGDADTIGAVLHALERQDMEEAFEVIVVASGGDATKDIVRRGHPGTVLLGSPDRLTPGAARNAGVDAATGREVIAFVAADCIPAPDWLRLRVEAHRRGHPLVGGFVDAARPSTCAGWAQYFAKFWGMQGLHRARGEGPGPLFHLSYAREALSNRWDESSIAGEDTAFNDALVREGHRVWFDAAIRVFHVNARRLSTVLAEQREQGHGVGRLCGEGDLSRYFVPLRGGPQMPFVLGWRCVVSTARHRPRLLARCVLVLPLTVAAMAARRRGFRAGLRAEPATPTPIPARPRHCAQPAPVVSVIVPAYNEERVLGACVDSLLAQAGPPLEVLVVDDGSTDATAAVAQARHVPVLQVPHGGPAAAKNAGAATARGDVLVFFDADLVAEPGAVEMLCQPILEGRSLGTYTAEIMVGNPDNPWADCWTYNRGAARGAHFPRQLPPQWDNFRAVRRDDFLRAGGYDDVGYGEDMTLAPKLRVKADAVTGARLWHHNPSTLHEIWENARWVGRGPAIHSGPRPARPRPLHHCLRRGVQGARRLGRPRFVVFALAYDLGIRSGLRSARRGRASHAK